MATLLRRQVFSPEFRKVLIASGVGHVLLTIFAATAALWRPETPPPPQNILVTKLVKLGKKRDEKLLPRLTQPPPPSQKAIDLPSPDAAPTTAAEPSVASATERLKEETRVSSALDRLKHAAQDEGEGDPEGVPEGEVTDLDKAIMGNKYLTEVYRCMKGNFNVEGVAAERVRGRQATVLVRAKGDGTLFGAVLSASSGFPPLDDAVLLAVKRCGRVSPPPAPLAETLARDGILIEFIP